MNAEESLSLTPPQIGQTAQKTLENCIYACQRQKQE
jgi:hypothetical protein